MIACCILLFLILVTETIQYIKISKLDKGTDEYYDEAFHDCHKVLSVVIDVFWMSSNLMLLCLGFKIKSASLNANLGLLSLEKDSFYRKGSDRLKIIEIRNKQ